MNKIILGSIPFLLLLTFAFLRSRHKWNISKEILDSITTENFAIFKGLDISSMSMSLSWNKWRDVWGFDIKGDLYLNDSEIIILPSKWTLMLFHTQLPRVINKTTHSATNFKKKDEVIITVIGSAYPLGKATINYSIETKDLEQKREIHRNMKAWY